MGSMYRFKDWTSAVKMKNQINPCLSIDVGVLRTNDERIEGYQLTVIDNSVNRIVYKYYIDVGIEGTWSLSTDEAIEMLNQIGFPCEYDMPTFIISEDAKDILRNLKGLGYTHVSRSAHPAEVEVYSPAIKQTVALSDITSYNYFDFQILTTVPTSIDSLIGDENG